MSCVHSTRLLSFRAFRTLRIGVQLASQLSLPCDNVMYNRSHMMLMVQHFQRFSTFHSRCDKLRSNDQNTHYVLVSRSEKYSKAKFSFDSNRKKLINKMSGKAPGLIVFDLDCTLWPYHVDSTVNPPFVIKDSKIVDQDGQVIACYPEVPEVLDYLKSIEMPIAVASRTTKPPAAFQLLELFDWNKFISYKEIYPGCKVTHFAKFVEKSQLLHQDMLFFDDEPRNIIDMEKEGVKCVLVQNGVSLQLVKDSIEKFKEGKL